MRKELVSICLGFPADELEHLNQLVAKLDISFAEFMSRLVSVAEEANRPWYFYPRTMRIPPGSRAMRKSFKVVPEIRARANRLADGYKITTSELLRFELQQPGVLEAVKKSKWKPDPSFWSPRQKAQLFEPFWDEDIEAIEEPEPTVEDILLDKLGVKPCRCGGEMYPRLRKRDYFCCNCRNKVEAEYAIR